MADEKKLDSATVKKRRRYEKPASLGASVFERRSLACSMLNASAPFCNGAS